MSTAWVLYEFAEYPDGSVRPEVVGVFSSKAAAVSAMHPGELAAPFAIDSRLPEGPIPYVPGEFVMNSDREIVDNEPPQA